MATYYRNPESGFVVKATGPFTWLWQLLFSPLHLAYHGIWAHAAISLVAAILTFGLSNFVYAFLGYTIINNYYRKLGWKEIPPDLVDDAKSRFDQRSTLSKSDLAN